MTEACGISRRGLLNGRCAGLALELTGLPRPADAAVSGAVVPANPVVAGTDPIPVESVAVSAASWHRLQFEGRQAEHLRAASQRSRGQVDMDRLRVPRTTA